MSSDNSEAGRLRALVRRRRAASAPAARPPAPEALDADTLAALNSLDGETLAGQLWDVLGGLAVNCARGDADSSNGRGPGPRCADAARVRHGAAAGVDPLRWAGDVVLAC